MTLHGKGEARDVDTRFKKFSPSCLSVTELLYDHIKSDSVLHRKTKICFIDLDQIQSSTHTPAFP